MMNIWPVARTDTALNLRHRKAPAWLNALRICEARRSLSPAKRFIADPEKAFDHEAREDAPRFNRAGRVPENVTSCPNGASGIATSRKKTQQMLHASVHKNTSTPELARLPINFFEKPCA
jgi:hypothetical protein